MSKKFIDERSYTVRTGKVGEFVRLYREKGYEVQKEYLGEPFGYFQTETGTLDQVVHMWAFDSAADRERRRQELAQDSRWVRYQQSSGHLLVARENRLLETVDLHGGD